MRFLFFIPLIVLLSCKDTRKLEKPAPGWKLVWADEFNYNGLPDSSKWSYNVGGNGYGNNELQYYTKADTANAVVRDGKLIIKILQQQKENREYTSARMLTKEKGDWLYGRVEVKAKLPAGRGLWPAIWMMPTDAAYGKWPGSGEIDIMENVGYNPDSVFSTIHTKAFNHIMGTQKSHGSFRNDLYNKFHVYGIEWDKDKIGFFIDKEKVFTFQNSGNGFAEWPYDKRFFLILNTAVGGNWGGRKGIDKSVFPAAMEVEYVRVYQKL